jgi:hypothetical protein
MSERRDVPPQWLEIPDPVAGQPATTPAIPIFASRAPIRRAVALRRAFVALGAALLAAAVLLLVGVRGSPRAHVGEMVAQPMLLGAFGMMAVFGAAGRGRWGVGLRLRWSILLAAGIPAGFVLFVWAFFPGAQPGEAVLGPFRSLVACFGTALTIVVPSAAGAAWGLRHSFLSGAAWRGGAVGAACGLLAALVLALHCGISLSGHVVLAHGLPIAIAALLGAFVIGKSGQV